jgi:Arc/MetJ family transcription regulator
MLYRQSMRTNIDIDEKLVRKARKLTRLKSKRQIVNQDLELLVRSEGRKGILRYSAVASGKVIPSPCGKTEFDLGGP